MHDPRAGRTAAAALLIVMSVGCGAEAGRCPDGGVRTVELLPGEVFLAACNVGGGRHHIVGAGFSPGETIDLVFDTTPLDPMAVWAEALRADGAGRLQIAAVVPARARYVRAYGDRGSFASTPLVVGTGDHLRGGRP